MPSANRRPMRALRVLVHLLIAAPLVSACGSGGGSETSGILYNQWGLGAIKADRSYVRLQVKHGRDTAPGSGQTVGVIDSGIDTEHPVFGGKRVTERFLLGATDETGDKVSHGTAVASVIAGRPPATGFSLVRAGRGIAWGADIAMFAIPLGGPGSPTYNPISSTGLARANDVWATIIGDVTGWSSGGRTLDFVNASVGYGGIIEQYSTPQLRAVFGDAIAALAQAGAARKTVFVWAAGNAHGAPCDASYFTDNPELCVNGVVDAKSVEILPGLPARIPELRGHMIAAVAVAPNGSGGNYEIASFSNRCGIAADWCIAAPGVAVRAAYFGPDPDDDSRSIRGAYDASGTSFAAPMVTGGLAVMKHYFRNQLSNTALVARMMATANKTGIYANRAIYGQGLLDLGAATAPVGVASIAHGARVDGLGDNLAQTRLALGGALGNGLKRALAGHEVAAFDSLGAPFWFPLGAFAGAAPGPSAAARLRAFTTPRQDRETGLLRLRYAALAGGDGLSLGIMQAPVANGGHLALAGRALALGSARGGLRFAAFSTEGLGQNPASGATLSWRPAGSPLSLTSGWIAERETVLGSSATGAFGRLSGSSAFVGIEGKARIGSWRLGAGAEIGTVRAAAQGGMLASISPLTTSAFAVGAARKLAGGDGLRISLAQPLRVEAGRARLTVPVGRTQDGRVLRRQLSAGLAPSGRQIDIAAEWHRSLADGGEIRIGAAWTLQPGHDAAADPELTLLAGWRHAF